MAETLFILILYLRGVPLEFMGHHDIQGQGRAKVGRIVEGSLHSFNDDLSSRIFPVDRMN